MLTCRELAHRHASDYLDGQLSWRRQLGVRYHLLICKHCRRFVAQLSKVRTLLRRKPENIAASDADSQELANKLADIYRHQKAEQQKKSPPPL